MAYVYATQDEAFNALEASDVPVGTRVVRNHDDDTWHFVDLDGAVVSDPADSASDPVAEVARVAQPGDLVIQIGGAWVADHAVLAAIAYAKKLGLEVTLRDAFSMEVVRTVSKADGRASRAARVLAPTENQTKLIALASRPGGATAQCFLDAGCDGNAKPRKDGTGSGVIAWKQLLEACVKFGYTYDSVKRNSQPTVYFLYPDVAAANDETDVKLAAD